MVAEGIQQWVCIDCIMLFANGENPPEMTEAELADWHARIDAATAGYWVACGGEHSEDCPNMESGQWVGTTDCDCETEEFSWRLCDTCGGLAGGRHAVTLFRREN